MTEIHGYKIHPLAENFPLMEGEDFDVLVASIKANDLRERIALTKQGKVIDGRNRLRALEQLKEYPASKYFCHPKKADGECYDDNDHDEIKVYIASANDHRLHLTAERRRESVAKLLAMQPQNSNRRIAKEAKVDDKTVAKVRRQMEGRAEIPHAEKRTDAAGREQPARRRAARKRAARKRKESAAVAANTLPREESGAAVAPADPPVEPARDVVKTHIKLLDQPAQDVVKEIEALFAGQPDMLEDTFAQYPDRITDEVFNACREIAERWARLVEDLAAMRKRAREAQGNNSVDSDASAAAMKAAMAQADEAAS